MSSFPSAFGSGFTSDFTSAFQGSDLLAGAGGDSGPALSLSFLTQTTLDSRVTFSRPSLATYDDGASLTEASKVLSIDFTAQDLIDSRITFSRPSLATYDDGVVL